MPTFEPVLLRRVGKPNSASLETYRADGGYRALEKALKMAPAEVTETVKASGLRGRGGAGFPTGVKWTFLPKDAATVYLAVNADESEPGTFNNRIIMEGDPHQIIEGIANRPSLLYLRGTRQPDPPLCHLLRVLRFSAQTCGNGAGDQGRWVTGAVT